LVKIPEEFAGLVAARDPGALHLAQLVALLRLQILGELAEALVEQQVPSRLLAVIALHLAVARLALGTVAARLRHDRNTVFPAFPLDALPDRRNVAPVRFVRCDRTAGGAAR